MDTTRREIAILGLAGAVVSLVGLPANVVRAAGARASGSAAGKPWYQDVRRVGQINTNERDVANFDVKAYADQMAECGCQAAVLSVGNMRAFYPTRIPNYLIAPGLGKRDLVRECVDALRARKIRIIARLSPDMQPTEVAAQRPEWFRRTKDGKMFAFVEGVREVAPGTPETGAGVAQNSASTCQFTTFHSAQIPAIINELSVRYRPDGFYLNGWPNGFTPPCWCAACQKVGDPTKPAYADAAKQRSLDLWHIFLETARSRNPDVFVSGNLMVSLAGSENGMLEITKDFPWLTIDHQNRSSPTNVLWGASQGARVVKSFAKDRPVAIVTAARNSGWRNASGESAEVTSRMIQTAAAGATIWHHWLGYNEGFVYDRRWQKTERDFLSWHARNDAHFRNRGSLANLGVVLSPQTNQLYKAAGDSTMQNTMEGVFAALYDARIPFDLVQDSDLDLENLSRFKALLLPNVALLSDRQRDQLAAYSANGGSLVATFETGLFDENGKARDNFALGDLFGIRKTGARQARLRPLGNAAPAPALYRITEKHPIVAGFRDTEWIEGAPWTVPFESDANPFLKFIPAYPWYPTEMSIVPVEEAKLPVGIALERGESRLVYLSGDIEASYWSTGGGDLLALLTNSIRWAMRDVLPVRVEGEGLAEIFGWQTEPGYAVHIVNYDSPNAFRKSQRRTRPLGPQHVTLTLDRDVLVRDVRLLRAEAPATFRQSGRIVEVTVPSVGDYEVVAFTV